MSTQRFYHRRAILRLSLINVEVLFFWIVLTVVVLCSTNRVSGQRFMRQGFSNNEDFGAEMKLDPSDNDAALGMTREMFLMQDLRWQIPPLQLADDFIDNIVTPTQALPMDPSLRKHILKYLGCSGISHHRKPIELELLKKRGKFGLRAIGTMDNGKKLRAFWRQSTSGIMNENGSTSRTSPSFLQMSYDDAVKSRLFTVEFEIQLPPIEIQENTTNSMRKKKKVLPSVVYQVPIESGSMNPQAIVPRGVGNVLVYPSGRQSQSSPYFAAGKCRISSVPMRAGLVDPSWSKGKAIFRSGRFAGIMI